MSEPRPYTIIVKARAKVLGLQPGETKVLRPNAMIGTLVRRGLVEVLHADVPNAQEAHGVIEQGPPDTGATEGAGGQETAQEGTEQPDGDEPVNDGTDEVVAGVDGASTEGPAVRAAGARKRR